MEEIQIMLKTKIKNILEKSNFKNPLIISTKFGFTKFWKDEEIFYSSMGENWNDKTSLTIDIDTAVEMIAKSKYSSLNAKI